MYHDTDAKMDRSYGPQNQMPHDYCKEMHAPLWTRRADDRYWIPLQTCKNAKKYFKEWCVANYEFAYGKWTFELDHNKESWWVEGDTNFECGLEFDDPNTSEYYLAADSETRTIEFVCVPSTIGQDIDMAWSEFETNCLFSRMKMVCLTNTPRALPDTWKHMAVELHKLLPNSQDKLHRECVRLMLGKIKAIEFRQLESCNDMFFLTSMCPKTSTPIIVAFAIGKHFKDRSDAHWKASLLVSCEKTFDMAHRLLFMIQQVLGVPCFPASIEDETGYWEQNAQYLVDSAINCIGWDFQEFLECNVEGFFNLIAQFHVNHNFFM